MVPEVTEIKNTLNLPKTSFSMKANLPQREPQMLKYWDAIDVYGRIRKARAGRPLYVLHDGPPYANGAIHMGTAINKILKDIIVKSHSMLGFDAPYLPGWDCHGLPIEIKVDQMLGAKKAGMSKVEIRRECRKYAEKYIDLQRKGFQRLGVFGEWDRPYLTMDFSYEADIVRAFGEFVDKGLVYKGLKPVHWCFSCKTALAEAEVEYEDHVSPSVYVAFPLGTQLSDLDPALAEGNWSVVIWTTTPWTLPANLAIAFHPDIEYAAVRLGDRGYVVAADLRSAGALLHCEDFTHTYPHCWRCHNPIIFRATPQWFVALDADGYRQRVLDAIKRVRWIPAWGEERITNMVKDRPDWCISRQRDWGVPIVAFYCNACNTVLPEKNVIDHVAS